MNFKDRKTNETNRNDTNHSIYIAGGSYTLLCDCLLHLNSSWNFFELLKQK